MTDNEIVKALERCNGLAPTDEVDCELCPFCDYDAHTKCTEELAKNVLYLIDRQKAEIERLENYIENIRCVNADLLDNHEISIKEARAEAIKEFAERLKDELKVSTLWGLVSFDRIDNLVKEMTEGNSNG